MRVFLTVLVAVMTQAVFFVGEKDLTSMIYNQQLGFPMLLEYSFGIFVVTRILGIIGQIWLWTQNPLGYVAVIVSMANIGLSLWFSVSSQGMGLSSLQYAALFFSALALVLFTV